MNPAWRLRGTWRWCAAACLMMAGAAQAATPSAIDPSTSWAGFSLKTRWGQTLEGRFPAIEGEIVSVGDARKRVHLRMHTRGVEIVDHPRYTQLTRGEGFFDAESHPYVVFVSDAFPESLVREGGKLAGDLSIRGTTRREVFTVEPAACARPGIDCDVVANGVVYRGDFDMDRWGFALSDRVRLTLRLRARNGAA